MIYVYDVLIENFIACNKFLIVYQDEHFMKWYEKGFIKLYPIGQAGSLLICANKVLWEHSHVHLFMAAFLLWGQF